MQINKRNKAPSKAIIFISVIFALLVILIVIIFTIAPLSLIKLSDNNNRLISKFVKINKMKEDLSYLENLLKENSNYYPGWILLSKINDENNNILGVETALEKAREIDPNGSEFTK